MEIDLLLTINSKICKIKIIQSNNVQLINHSHLKIYSHVLVVINIMILTREYAIHVKNISKLNKERMNAHM